MTNGMQVYQHKFHDSQGRPDHEAIMNYAKQNDLVWYTCEVPNSAQPDPLTYAVNYYKTNFLREPCEIDTAGWNMFDTIFVIFSNRVEKDRT